MAAVITPIFYPLWEKMWINCTVSYILLCLCPLCSWIRRKAPVWRCVSKSTSVHLHEPWCVIPRYHLTSFSFFFLISSSNTLNKHPPRPPSAAQRWLTQQTKQCPRTDQGAVEGYCSLVNKPRAAFFSSTTPPFLDKQSYASCGKKTHNLI